MRGISKHGVVGSWILNVDVPGPRMGFLGENVELAVLECVAGGCGVRRSSGRSRTGMVDLGEAVKIRQERKRETGMIGQGDSLSKLSSAVGFAQERSKTRETRSR